MLSRQEVAEIERDEAREAFRENEKRYGGRLQKTIDELQKEVEDLRKIVAFYQEENPSDSHKVEKEYLKLVKVKPSKRNKEQKERLVYLAKAISKAADVEEKAFIAELDKHVNE